MPEDLTPGVYIAETGTRSRSIEGVSTSTLGLTGATEYGPVRHPSGIAPPTLRPVLVTSMTAYERAFGGLAINGAPCQLALAARSFFANGGRRLYVQRVFVPTAAGGDAGPDDDIAVLDLPPGADPPVVRWQARWPGAAGARLRVATRFKRSANVQVGTELHGVLPGAAVETMALAADGRPPVVPDDQLPADLRVVTRIDGVLGFSDGAGGPTPPVAGQAAFHITVDVEVRFGDRRDRFTDLELGAEHLRYVVAVMQHLDPGNDGCPVWLTTPTTPTPDQLVAALLAPGRDGAFLSGGSDGADVTASALRGHAADTVALAPATGLAALAEIDDIAIVAMPDTTALSPDEAKVAVDALIDHCARERYRIGIIDPPRDSSISDVRAFRSQFDSAAAALYYPWLRVVDPTRPHDPQMPPPLLDIPPSGAIAGVFARSDIERGVHRAPADAAVVGVTGFVADVTSDQQSVLGPEGINVLRSFEGGVHRVWGARTISSDPEWKYVNVRRLLIFLEHSIDRSTQWAVFEPNDEQLWTSIRQTTTDFLGSMWRTGALVGTRPEDAFFVRCDRSTMTQDDLDDGRLVCLIGVAPTRPAEFVVFRIGQWTADSSPD